MSRAYNARKKARPHAPKKGPSVATKPLRRLAVRGPVKLIGKKRKWER